MKAAKGGLFKRAKANSSQYGLVRDVSVSGAAIEAATDDALQRGTLMEVELNRIEGEVVIKRIEPSSTPGLSVYGVEFNSSHDALAREFQDVFMGQMKRLPPEWQDPDHRDLSPY
jgi:hypothetical protein